MNTYGRDEAEWDLLTDEGLAFLIEQAKLKRITSYTELNATLARRTGLRPFNFERDIDRAAMGQLLGRIVERNLPETGFMISALVVYLNENDAGSGFYAFAKELGKLSNSASSAEKWEFWLGQVAKAHEFYGSPTRR